MIPLYLRIKREAHRKIASAQDSIVEELYKVFPKAVFHGGTAIWRCYSGKRFSEDLDFYLPKDPAKIEELFRILEKKGFRILKKKISENSIYSEVEIDRINVRLEATFQLIRGHIVDYEMCDGTTIVIYGLLPEEFIREKISAYMKRLKIRDLYDIFFLLTLTKHLKSISGELSKLIKNYTPPLDEKDLKAILLEGITPTSKEMIEYIKRKWESANTI